MLFSFFCIFIKGARGSGLGFVRCIFFSLLGLYGKKIMGYKTCASIERSRVLETFREGCNLRLQYPREGNTLDLLEMDSFETWKFHVLVHCLRDEML